MSTQNKNKVAAVAVALIAIAAGLLFSPLSRQYPVFHWLLYLEPALVGLLPITTPQPWGYTFEQLQNVDLRGQNALVTGEFMYKFTNFLDHYL